MFHRPRYDVASLRFGLDCFLRPAACKGLYALAVLICRGVWSSGKNCTVTLSLSCCGGINVFVFSHAIVKEDDAVLISGVRRAAAVRDFIKCHAVPAKRSDHASHVVSPTGTQGAQHLWLENAIWGRTESSSRLPD